MMKKDSLKKLGILGVSFGLMASPLAFAGMEDDTAPQEPAPHEDTMQDDQATYNSDDGATNQGNTGTMQDHGTATQGTDTQDTSTNTTTEYEEEEQEWDTDTDTDTDTDIDTDSDSDSDW